MTLVSVLGIDAALLVAMLAASYVKDSTYPAADETYVIDQVSCEVEYRSNDAYIVATTILSNPSKNPWLFHEGELALSIGARPSASDLVLQSPLPKGSEGLIRWREPLVEKVVASGLGKIGEPLLLGVGSSTWLVLEARLNRSALEFLAEHRNGRCTVVDNTPAIRVSREGFLRYHRFITQ